MPRKRQSSQPSLLFPALIVLLLILAGLVAWEYLRSTPEPVPPVVVTPPAPHRSVTLYFATPAADHLVAEERELDNCPLDPPCYAELIQALLQGPRSGLVPVLPPQATLRSVFAEGETLTLDFSRELVDNHPGGSLSELLTVTALAATVQKNFPQLRQVRLLVEGATVETLKGHVALREPIRADFSLMQIQPAAPAGTADPTQGARQ